ncbi:hypothetical protein [Pseudomonas putida]|uniref:hypothetical protein n=1 Tax=Pseudomonas putida TaxID=303 RepID=UPI0005BA7172|nr:hypothetical protein [Pseudomonas putida]
MKKKGEAGSGEAEVEASYTFKLDAPPAEGFPWWRFMQQRAGADEAMVAPEELVSGVWKTVITTYSHLGLRLSGISSRVHVVLGLPAFAEARTRKESSVGVKQIIRIQTQIPMNGELRIEPHRDNSHLFYNGGDPQDRWVKLRWSGVEYLSFYDYDTKSTRPVPADLQKYYEQTKSVTLWRLSSEESAAEALQLYGYFSSRSNVDTVTFYKRPQSLRQAEQAQPIHETPVENAAFPMLGTAPLLSGVSEGQARWIVDVVMPPGTFSLNEWKRDGTRYVAKYSANLLPSIDSAVPPAARAAVRSAIFPQLAIVKIGAQKEPLQLVGELQNPSTWQVEGEAKGTIDRNGGVFYVPPTKFDPQAMFNENSETFIPAAYRTGIDLPVRVDRVTASGTQGSAQGVFLVTLVPPTHFIRFQEKNGQLYLTSCFIHRDGGERVLPPDDVKWHIVTGDGSVTDDGHFIPGSAGIDSITVVMAEDLRDQTEWRYALTIVPVPFFSASLAQRLQRE